MKIILSLTLALLFSSCSSTPAAASGSGAVHRNVQTTAASLNIVRSIQALLGGF